MFVLSMWSNRHFDPFDGAFGENEVPLFLLLLEHGFLDLAGQHAGFVEQQLELAAQLESVSLISFVSILFASWLVCGLDLGLR